MKLKGASDYSIWALKMKQIMLREKVWIVVDPSYNIDDTSTSSDSTSSPNSGAVTGGAPPAVGASSSSTSTVLPNTGQTVAELQELKNKAFALIILSVKDTIIPHLMSFFDPTLVWNKLKNLYESSSSARRLMLNHKLYTIRFPENRSVEDYLKTLGMLITQLGNFGTHLEDEEIVDVVLTGLPPSWNVFRQMMMARSVLPSFAELESALLLEAVRRDLDRNREDEDEALFARTQFSHHRGQNSYRGSSFRGNQGRQAFR